MGDFFEDPKQMLGTSDAKLQELSRLIKKDKAGPAGVVSNAEWDTATDNRYSELATKNEEHFAPSRAAYAPVSGKAAGDHKSAWEKYHAAAISESQGGNKDQALATNAYADHFLTDAFSAGHLINKRDVMELFKGNLPVDAKGDFTAASESFFDNVAKKSFVGAVKTEFSQYETVKWKGVFFRPNIDSVGIFSRLLQGIHQQEPDLLSNAVVKAVHDTLNKEPGGVPVENNMGDKWSLSGDATLNDDTRRIARNAVAQSQLNVLDVFKVMTPVDLPAAFKRVWGYVPHTTAAAEKTVKTDVTTGTDPKSAALTDAVAALITRNYPRIIAELVRRKILKKA
jgi:hypothetical protein